MERRYKIGEFSKITGVSIDTLRRWDNEGKFKANRAITGHRYYTDDHLKQLREKEVRK